MDPYDPRLISPFEHQAFFTNIATGPCCDDHEISATLVDPRIAPIVGDAADRDTGLRCYCGREVVSTLSDDAGVFGGTGWAHVGVGDACDPAGEDEWEEAAGAA